MSQQEYRNAFNLYDREGKGRVPSKELGTVMRALGYNPAQQHVQQLLNEVCRGGKDFSFDDLCKVIQHCNNHPGKYGYTEEEIRDAFKVFDREGGGYISAVELKHVVTSLGEKLTDEESNILFQETSVNADGMCSVDELVEMMKPGK